VLSCDATSTAAFSQLFGKAPCQRHQTSLLCANHHTMQKAGKVDRTLRYGGARISQKDGVTGVDKKRRFERRRPKLWRKLPGIGVQPVIRFNDHPAAIFGLRFIMHNFAEAIEIESRDVVIALPSQVDVQSALGAFIVYAYDEGCIPHPFHRYRFFRLFPVDPSNLLLIRGGTLIVIPVVSSAPAEASG
jgi:hypothetical protein